MNKLVDSAQAILEAREELAELKGAAEAARDEVRFSYLLLGLAAVLMLQCATHVLCTACRSRLDHLGELLYADCFLSKMEYTEGTWTYLAEAIPCTHHPPVIRSANSNGGAVI